MQAAYGGEAQVYVPRVRARIRVLPNEMTCLVCGEVFVAGSFCVVCGRRGDDGEVRAVEVPAVPTVSYLKPEEWERA